MKIKAYNIVKKLLVVLFAFCFLGATFAVTFNAKADAGQNDGFELIGAEVRSDAPAGIRFVTNVSKDFYDDYSGYEFGTLVIPTNLLNGADLTLDTQKAQKIVTQNWKVKPDSGEDTYQYTSTLVGNDLSSQLPVENWNTKLTAISYAWDGQDPATAVYSGVEVRSLAQVAAGVLASGEMDPDEDVDFLNQICNTVIGTETLTFEEGESVKSKDLGEKIALTLTGNQGLDAIWSSNSETITVDRNGVVSATSFGDATITATIGTKTATIKVNYVEPVITSLSFNQESIELYSAYNLYGLYGGSFSNVAGPSSVWNTVNNTKPIASVLTAYDQDGETIDLSDIDDISYISGNTGIARINGNNIQGWSPDGGSFTTITATANGVSATLKVYVRFALTSKADLDILGYAASVKKELLESDKYYVLTKDIDYNDQELVPIAAHPHLTAQAAWGRLDYGTLNPSFKSSFAATLDGKGHVIKNAYIPSTVLISNQNVNTFGSFIGDLSGTLKNIGFVNLRTKLIADETGFTGTNQDYQISSGLVCRNQGVMENIYLDMKIYKQSYTTTDYISGALAARAHGGSTTRNCIVVSEKDYSNSNHASGNAKDWGAAFGLVLGANSTETTVSNVFAVSSTLTRFVAYPGSGAPYGDTLNNSNLLYTSVSDLIAARSTEISEFGGYWNLSGSTLKFGNTEIK